MSPEHFATLALSLPEAVESAHFGKRDFRVGSRIFATLPAEDQAVLKLTPDQQALAIAIEAGRFRPAAKSWGAQGWTQMDLAGCPADLALSMLTKAWSNVATRAIVRRHRL